MIAVKQNGKEIIITVSIKAVTEWSLQFKFHCDNDLYAELLVQKIQEAIRNEIESIRSNEYDAGWRDAKAKKRPKRTWFASTFSWRNS